MRFPRVVRDQAFDLWMTGKSVAEVSRELGISVATVGSWCTKDSWPKKKKAAMLNAESTILARFEKRIVNCSEVYFNVCLMIAVVCQKKLELAMKQDNPDISAIVLDAQRGSQIMRNILPDAGENIAKQIIDEIKQSTGYVVAS